MEHLYRGMFQYLNWNIWILKHICLFAYIIFEQCCRLNSVLFMFEYSSVGTFVWLIVLILDHVAVRNILYLGVGAFVWRYVSISKYKRWSTSIFFYYPSTWVVLEYQSFGSFVWRNVSKCLYLNNQLPVYVCLSVTLEKNIQLI